MNPWISILARVAAGASLAISVSVFATTPPLSAEAKEHIAKHEKIAAAHTEAAKCLREGKSEKVCEAPLQQACKGIAIGKYCGMKH
jgi:hypothetical protein